MNFRWLGGATILGIASMLALIALGERKEIIGLAVLIGISVAVYVLQTQVSAKRSATRERS